MTIFVQKRNLETQKVYMKIHAPSGEWVIWPKGDLNKENIKTYCQGVKVFEPGEVRGLSMANAVLVFNFDTGVGVEVVFQG